MSRVLTCPEGSYDEQTATCAAPVWTEQGETVLPALTTAEGHQIALAIMAVWAVAWVLKIIARTVAQLANPEE